MTYLVLSVAFVGGALLAALLLSRRPPRPGLRVTAITLVCLFLLTAVFDTVMIAAGLFTYAESHLIGARVGLAPIEDFAYPLAAAILLPALWLSMRRPRDP